MSNIKWWMRCAVIDGMLDLELRAPLNVISRSSCRPGVARIDIEV
jgi:hypothetical protein